MSIKKLEACKSPLVYATILNCVPFGYCLSYISKVFTTFCNLILHLTTLPKLDVLYMTRVQKERFFNEEEYLRLKDVYILDEEKLKLADKDMPVLHPLPRVDEISLDVDDDPRAAYFDQVQNGKYIRMALIMALLGITDPVTGRKVLDTHSL